MRFDELRDRSRSAYEAGGPAALGTGEGDTMSVSEFKATCLRVFERIRQTGRPLLITKRGIPLAQVLPPPPTRPTGEETFGCMAGTCEEVGDLLEPLDPDDWEVLG